MTDSYTRYVMCISDIATCTPYALHVTPSCKKVFYS